MRDCPLILAWHAHPQAYQIPARAPYKHSNSSKLKANGIIATDSTAARYSFDRRPSKASEPLKRPDSVAWFTRGRMKPPKPLQKRARMAAVSGYAGFISVLRAAKSRIVLRHDDLSGVFVALASEMTQDFYLYFWRRAAPLLSRS